MSWLDKICNLQQQLGFIRLMDLIVWYQQGRAVE